MQADGWFLRPIWPSGKGNIKPLNRQGSKLIVQDRRSEHLFLQVTGNLSAAQFVMGSVFPSLLGLLSRNDTPDQLL